MAMQQSARSALLSLVEEHLTGLIRDAVSVQRHSKRARLHEAADDNKSIVRRRLHGADINMALQLNGSEKLYATAVVKPDPDDSNRKVDLQEYLRSSAETMPSAPSEVGLKLHWLAVDGVQPEIPQNQSMDGHRANTIPRDEAAASANAGQLRVSQLQASLLSEELQLYFSRVTSAIERGAATSANRKQQDDVLRSLAQDHGLQELVPFMVRYCQQELYKHVGNTEHCRTLIRLTRSLLQNPHLHLELHLHELLPALMTCVVAQRLSSNHWALRRDAALALVQACHIFGRDYSTLKARVLRALCEAIGPNKTMACRYGGTVAITLFGSRAIDSFLLPAILSDWEAWERTLDDQSLDSSSQLEIFMCQHASLDALGVLLRDASAMDLSERVDSDHLEDVLGDRVATFASEPSEYGYCFV